MAWKQVSVAVLLIQAVCCTPEPGAAPDEGQSAVHGALGRKIDQYVSSAALRGFSGTVLVESEGEVVLRKGYGWTDSTRSFPITPRTLFFIASVTKGLTAAAILQLEEAGQLRLDQRLTEFFDGVPPQLQSATLHQVLIHRSGLGNNYGGSGINDRDAAVADIFSFPVAYAPGTDFIYSNDGYSLLAAVIEVTAKQTFEDYVRKKLLETRSNAQCRILGAGRRLGSFSLCPEEDPFV